MKYILTASQGSGATFMLYNFLRANYNNGLLTMSFELGYDESHKIFEGIVEYSPVAHHNNDLIVRLSKRYPNMKIIHLVRNGFDAMNSKITRNYLINSSMDEYKIKKLGIEKDSFITKLAKLWVYDIQEAIKLRGYKNYLEIRYEDICNNPEEELKRIEQFLGLKNYKSLKFLKENLKPAIGKHKTLSKEILNEIKPIIELTNKELGYEN